MTIHSLIPRPLLGAAAALALAACAAPAEDLGAREAPLLTLQECEVMLAGTSNLGDLFLAGATLDVLGGTGGSLLHMDPAGVVVGSTGPPSRVRCRVNGTIIATVEGPTTFGGLAATYEYTVQDRRGPVGVTPTPFREILVASKSYLPPTWKDDFVGIPGGGTFDLPGVIPVTVGNAGNHWTEVRYHRPAPDNDEVICCYRGGSHMSDPEGDVQIELGTRYELDRCTHEEIPCENGGGTDIGLVAGDTVAATWVRLRIIEGSSSFPPPPAAPLTEVELTLDITPIVTPSPDPDLYRLEVFDPSGMPLYVRDAEVVTGDVSIDM
jgi:hypothetical protein